MMKKTGERLLALVMALCLTLALGTTALATEVPQTIVAATVGGKNATAGEEVTTITLTATYGSFAASQDKNNYKITVAEPFGFDGAIEVSNVTTSGDGNSAVDLTVNKFTPTKQGSLAIEINKAAFGTDCNFESEPITATLSINPAVWLKEGEGLTTKKTSGMKAGVDGGEVTLTISDGFTNTFADTSSTENYYISDPGGTNLELASVTTTDKVATLKFSGKPTAPGFIKVKLKATAFKFQLAGETEKTFTIDTADTPTVTASGTLYAGTEGTITLTSSTNPFQSELQESWFTLTGCTAENPSAVSGGGETVSLSVTPNSMSDVTVQIDSQAFTYQPDPEKLVNADGTIPVNEAPTVTLSADGIAAGDTD